MSNRFRFNQSCSRGLLVISLTLPGLTGLLGGCQPKTETPAPPVPRKVSALGRVEPETKIRKVSVSSSLSGDRIEKILVDENQWVKQGQALAILNSYGTLKAALDEAKQDVTVAQSSLDQVKAGAKQGEIKAQEYKIQSLQHHLAAEKLTQDQTVARYKARRDEAKLEAKRYDELFRSGAASEIDRDRYRTRAETTEAELQEAIENRSGKLLTLQSEIESEQQTLAKISEVRTVDVRNAEAALGKAIAARNRAQQEFDYATVLAPQEGQILKIIARPGDKVSDDGVLQMADTRKMIVTAEVYQTDMPKIFKGQKATITADGFQGSIQGVVYQVNPQVEQQTIFSDQPGENLDQRVFEVKIRLSPKDIEEKKIKYVSNLQVNVVFDPKAES
ncbi:MAG TPA: efflux RND transporter periplasmic adaptor subunit [Coleofasciculaceae cyanobacterium]